MQEDVVTPDILITYARAICHILSDEEAQWARSSAMPWSVIYMLGSFNMASPLLQAAHAKAAAADDKELFWLMIQDCHGHAKIF